MQKIKTRYAKYAKHATNMQQICTICKKYVGSIFCIYMKICTGPCGTAALLMASETVSEPRQAQWIADVRLSGLNSVEPINWKSLGIACTRHQGGSKRASPAGRWLTKMQNGEYSRWCKNLICLKKQKRVGQKFQTAKTIQILRRQYMATKTIRIPLNSKPNISFETDFLFTVTVLQVNWKFIILANTKAVTRTRKHSMDLVHIAIPAITHFEIIQ